MRPFPISNGVSARRTTYPIASSYREAKTMRSEHLGIGDRTFLINRLIQQAPINTLVREFLKNADENAALAPKGRRVIKIFPTIVGGVRKLTFWNTGIGMSAVELKTATDL